MSQMGSTFIILIMLISRSTSHAHSINFEALCNSTVLATYGGNILVQESKQYKVECNSGYVVPLSSPNQSYIYECQHGTLKTKLPEGCVEKRIPYRKVGFQILLGATQKTLELCKNATKQSELSGNYNRTKKATLFLQSELYIKNCSLSTVPSDYILINAVATKLLKQNTTSDFTSGGYAHAVYSVFKLLLDCMQNMGYLTAGQEKTASLIYHANMSLVGFHCDDHLEMRVDDGEFVCVGCGKGFWMDQHRECHPCGPGFYNPVETAVECLPCPVQYENGLWSADSISECFQTRRDQLDGYSRLLEGLIVPIIYLLILLVVALVLHNRKSLPLDCKRSRMDSSMRFSSTFQPQ